VSDPNPVRQLVYFRGHVQGVGFRYTACRVAAGFRVSGYVRNLPDGRVELTAEGTSAELDRFVAELRQTMSGYVRQADVHHLPATGEFEGFQIRH
jgi:acylphosphatase